MPVYNENCWFKNRFIEVLALGLMVLVFNRALNSNSKTRSFFFQTQNLTRKIENEELELRLANFCKLELELDQKSTEFAIVGQSSYKGLPPQ